jgi:hypothetical protein
VFESKLREENMTSINLLNYAIDVKIDTRILLHDLPKHTGVKLAILKLVIQIRYSNELFCLVFTGSDQVTNGARERQLFPLNYVACVFEFLKLLFKAVLFVFGLGLSVYIYSNITKVFKKKKKII